MAATLSCRHSPARLAAAGPGVHGIASCCRYCRLRYSCGSAAARSRSGCGGWPSTRRQVARVRRRPARVQPCVAAVCGCAWAGAVGCVGGSPHPQMHQPAQALWQALPAGTALAVKRPLHTCIMSHPSMAPTNSNFGRWPSPPLPPPLGSPSHCTLACGAGLNVAPPSCDSNRPAGG